MHREISFGQDGEKYFTQVLDCVPSNEVADLSPILKQNHRCFFWGALIQGQIYNPVTPTNGLK